MKISLVIRCYNEDRHIGRLLNGLLQQSESDVEIVVVDSGSTDNTCSIVSQYPVEVMPIPKEEFSFGRAASGDIIVIASAHVYPLCRDWLEQLTAPFVDPKIALVYGKQVGDTTTKYSEHRILAKRFPNRSNWDQEQRFCNNANAAIWRSVFRGPWPASGRRTPFTAPRSGLHW